MKDLFPKRERTSRAAATSLRPLQREYYYFAPKTAAIRLLGCSRLPVRRSRWRGEFGLLLPLVVPDSQHAVESAGDDRFAVGAGSDRVHVFGRAAEIALAIAVGGVDEPHLGITAAGHDDVVHHKTDTGD